jgi:hypothetical protein
VIEGVTHVTGEARRCDRLYGVFATAAYKRQVRAPWKKKEDPTSSCFDVSITVILQLF